MIKKSLNKLFLFIIVIFINTSLGYETRAFLDGGLGTSLYKNIDQGLEDLEYKMFQKELNIEGSIDDTINNYAKKTGIKGCLKNLNIKNATQYITIGEVYNYIDLECLNLQNKDGISITELNTYKILINDFISISNYKSQLKTKKVYEIAHLGLYTDGESDNSPFDLIVDLQEINNIIFNNKIKYDSEDIDFLRSFKKNPSTLIKVNPPETENINQNKKDKNTNNTTKNNDNKTVKDDVINTDGNNYNCPQDNSNSGLSPEEQKKLLSNISNNDYALKVSDNGIISMPKSNQLDIPNLGEDGFNGNYNGVNDNAFWPCNDFFCIKIGFDTYNIRVLDYSSSISIENVINKSNSHLKKLVNTSAQQGKQSTNYFEIGLRDLDLPGQFHIGFVMEPKSPPILQLENILKKSGDKEDKPLMENKEKRNANDQLEQYYKNLNLDYKRANDINIFRGFDQDNKNIINNTTLNPQLIAARNAIEQAFNKKFLSKIKFIDKSYDMDLNNDILGEFYEETVELNGFIISIIEYTKELNTLIIALREIPIFSE